MSISVSQYPHTHRDPIVEEHFGMHLEDPYRWLEAIESDDVHRWVDTQNEYTASFIRELPGRDLIATGLARLFNRTRRYIVMPKQGRYFYEESGGGEDQFSLYMGRALDDPKPQKIVDPNLLSTDGTVALDLFSVSHDASKVAYALTSRGSDWLTIRIHDVESGTDLPEVLHWSKFTDIAWGADGLGFYYSRYHAPSAGPCDEDINRHQKVYYHRLGDPQEMDRLVIEDRDNPDSVFLLTTTFGGRHTIVSAHDGVCTENTVGIIDTVEAPFELRPLITEADALYEFLGGTGETFFFRTTLDAPNGRIIAIDTNSPDRSRWRTVAPETTNFLANALHARDMVLVHRLADVSSRLAIYSIDGEYRGEIELPGPGVIGWMTGDEGSGEVFYSFTSLTHPASIYRYDLSTSSTSLHYSPDIDFDPDDYETRRCFYPSRDGTMVPIFIAHRRGLPLDGSAPCILHGYGGYGSSELPYFRLSNVLWYRMGGVFAIANLRGGGEYGEEWHRAGMLERKQNCFDDFIAAAKFLTREGYTSHERLAIHGESNGGLLVGACIAQRPDLFRAAVPAVGMFDMLRFHLFTNGHVQIPEFGNPESADDFAFLARYSPMHNIRPGEGYPATLIMTGDNDDRVPPASSYKFAAMLQACQGTSAPILLRVERDAGHGHGKPLRKLIDETSDMFAFLSWALGGDGVARLEEGGS